MNKLLRNLTPFRQHVLLLYNSSNSARAPVVFYRTSAEKSVVGVDAGSAVLARIGAALVPIQKRRQLSQPSVELANL